MRGTSMFTVAAIIFASTKFVIIYQEKHLYEYKSKTKSENPCMSAKDNWLYACYEYIENTNWEIIWGTHSYYYF